MVFCCTTEWISYKYAHIPFLLSIHAHVPGNWSWLNPEARLETARQGNLYIHPHEGGGWGKLFCSNWGSGELKSLLTFTQPVGWELGFYTQVTWLSGPADLPLLSLAPSVMPGCGINKYLSNVKWGLKRPCTLGTEAQRDTHVFPLLLTLTSKSCDLGLVAWALPARFPENLSEKLGKGLDGGHFL